MRYAYAIILGVIAGAAVEDPYSWWMFAAMIGLYARIVFRDYIESH